MKILDKYILKTFSKTFFTVFAILFLIFILQAIWLFIPELAGKDLDGWLICKFLLFKMPALVPMSLPLSVLLASIMTFGDLSENYEFAAMKSAGISLKRALYSTTIFIGLLTIATFFFANNVIPYSEYKFVNFRKNIAQKKPALAITEGQFSTVGTFSIKVDKKLGENGNILKGITIHEKSLNNEGNKKVIKAKYGLLISNEKSNYLKLVLNNGFYYEDIIPIKWEDKNKLPFAKSNFGKYTINIDLTKLNDVNMNDESVTNTDNMLTVSQLNYALDSLNKTFKKDVLSFSDNIYQRTGVNNINKKIKFKEKITSDILSNYDDSKKSELVKMAMNNVTSTIFSIDASKIEFEYKQKNIDAYWISFYFKFVIAFSCILMFFIGAPLGAIIRKGGLGLPMIFAVLIFIIFHFVNTFGKKLAEEGGISPFMGCWLSTLILGPLGILLTYRAMNDIGGTINFDVITDPIKLIYLKIFPAKEEQNKPKIKAINLIKLEKIFKICNIIALGFYFLALLLILISLNFKNPIVLKLTVIVIFLVYVFGFFAHKSVEKINGILTKKHNLKLFLLFLFSLPLYFLFYVFSKKIVENPLKNYLANNSSTYIETFENFQQETKISNPIRDKSEFIKNTKFGLLFYSLTLISLGLTIIYNKPLFIVLSLIDTLILYLFAFKVHNYIEKTIENQTKKTVSLILFLTSIPLFVFYFIYARATISKK